MSNQKKENACKCNEKGLCCKMQKVGLQVGISTIKSHAKCSALIVSNELKGICNILSLYNCEPASYLHTRAEWLLDNIRPSAAYSMSKCEKANFDMFIAELEAFLDI